jgi:hypothetical protein
MATDQGPGSRLWNSFANVDARRRRVVDCGETAPTRGEFGDTWADKAFNVKGPDLFDIQRRSHTDGNG